MNLSAHCFALYSSEQLTCNELGQILIVRNQDLWTRIVRVLRLRIGERVILFDSTQSITLSLLGQTFQNKETIAGTVLALQPHKVLSPFIDLCIGLLKKEALEEVVYDATALGAASIIPVITRKVQRSWGGQKERDRLFKIMIAAAEQSKQFVFPKLENPITFDQLLNRYGDQKSKNIYFDIDGAPALEIINAFAQQKPPTLTLLWGAEGGFESEEITLLQQKNFLSASLTPTVLRSTEAVTVGLGMMRSCLQF